MTLFGYRDFADIIKARIEMRIYWIRVDPNSSGSVLIRDRKGHRHEKEAI